MEISLYGELLMEIRRLHAIGTSFGVSGQENIKAFLKELNSASPSLMSLIRIVEGDPGLSVAVIKIANCTLINGAASKKVTPRQAAIRIGVEGLDVAVRIYQASILQRLVVSKCWRDHMATAMDNVLLAGSLSYKIAMALTNKKQDAEWALQLAVLYSLGMFAKIIAADSLKLSNTQENRAVVLENCAVSVGAVLLSANANYNLIGVIERIETNEKEDVGIIAAKAGWGFLKGTMDLVEYNGIELTRNSFRDNGVL
jgi:hypothetical protein